MSTFDQMREAMREANIALNAADSVAGTMASMLVGRLRHVDSRSTLSKLKRELRDFNIHTGRWSRGGTSV